MSNSSSLVWIDCEMTGLDLGVDEIVELAVIVTDSELNELGEGIDVIIRPSDQALEHMGEFVRQMHTNSGLINEFSAGMSVAQAQQCALDYLASVLQKDEKPPLAGNSVGTDKAFLVAQMPELVEALHYRTIDVSSIKELAKRWLPRAYYASPEKQGGHRALADIRESIQELRYYREILFTPQSEITSDRCREIALEVSSGLK